MRERSEQDRLWTEQKKQSRRINRLIADGFYYGGEYCRQLVPLKTILKVINKEVREAGSYPELGITVRDRI